MNNVVKYLVRDAAAFPDKKAVSLRDESYTYAQLADMAKRMAYLITPKNGNRAVGVIASQEINTLVYFFAVLFSGNYYVPIDPDMPREKKEIIIRDAEMTVILGDRKALEKLDGIAFDGALLSIDDMTQESFDAFAVGNDAPVYMVYTSGSTGIPKGVLKSHAAVISFIETYCRTFDFSHDEIIGNQTPFFFDASAKDIYLMLKLGCTIEILPSTLFSLPPELIDYLNRKRVTFASWVPTALSLISQLNPFSMVKPETLKKVFFVGEVMPMKHLNRWRDNLPDVQYVNLYGQSEIAGVCCYYEVAEQFSNDETLPIGKPLANCRVCLVKDEKVIRTPGETGEIYIASDALATEYFNDAEKTKASFLYRDFGFGVERFFKTGDLAQYNEKGELVFASRSDYQIKHMGRRIELGEIETIANGVDAIQRSCCIYDQEKRKLILFCELDKNESLSGQEIRSILRDKLTPYMFPNKVVVLEKLPINANGKIDRKKLKEGV